MAAQIITIAIEKGGAGKTVTASNLAYLMGDEGKKVLCIDTDPQGNLTSALSGGNGITSGVYNGKALFDMFDGFRYTRTRDYIVAVRRHLASISAFRESLRTHRHISNRETLSACPIWVSSFITF